MKRSEMLEQLKKCFHEYSPDYGLDYVFERMLKRAENLGMLPPVTEESKELYRMEQLWHHEWDEEDED